MTYWSSAVDTTRRGVSELWKLESGRVERRRTGLMLVANNITSVQTASYVIISKGEDIMQLLNTYVPRNELA